MPQNAGEEMYVGGRGGARGNLSILMHLINKEQEAL